MRPRELYIPTTWRVKATAEQVYDVLSKPREFPRWWPEVYLDVKEVKAGDADGRGEWQIRQDGEWVVVTYDWTVLATKPWMIVLAPVLKPVFVWNHRWATQRGFDGLTRELARRAAA